MPQAKDSERMTEVRCPRCDRYICSTPEGTPVRAYCRDCAMKFEVVARGLTTPGR